MPKRTNIFQELVAIIHSRLGSGWTVSESMLLPDGITGEPREVDVVARATVAGYDIYISVECRDHQRAADVTWVEGMAKKHEHLPTSKLVLWSRAGFTKSALVKAAALKIDTVSQAMAAPASWANWARSLIGGRVRLLTPHFTPFIDIQPTSGSPRRLEDVSAFLIYDEHGQVIQSIETMLALMSASPNLGSKLLDHAPTGAGDFYGEVRPDAPWFAETPEGRRERVLRIGFGIKSIVESLDLDTASANVDGKVATLAAADSAAGRFQFYVEETPDGAPPVARASVRTKST